MSMCRVFSCCWKIVSAITSVFSWQNSISLCPASFCTPRPNLPVTPGASWLPTFAFQSPIMKRTSFLGVSLKGLVSLHRTIQLQLLQHYWSGHRLGFLWYWITEIILNCLVDLKLPLLIVPQGPPRHGTPVPGNKVLELTPTANPHLLLQPEKPCLLIY